MFKGIKVHEVPPQDDTELIVLLVEHLVSILLGVLERIGTEINMSKSSKSPTKFKGLNLVNA